MGTKIARKRSETGHAKTLGEKANDGFSRSSSAASFLLYYHACQLSGFQHLVMTRLDEFPKVSRWDLQGDQVSA